MALAIAALTLSWSSFDIKRPALPEGSAGFGSSDVNSTFEECTVTVVCSVVASAVGRPSGVTKSALPALRS